MELTQLREKIDGIDRELVALFIQRMGVSAEVAEYKRRTKMAVLDADRERMLLDKVSALSGEQFEEYTRALYATILELSREYQQKALDAEDKQ
jgi:chorismate mutase/prephenate dehydratase